ncbi:MAG: helix-turn-helix transcriptional regulator [Neisseriaceae bacterium]
MDDQQFFLQYKNACETMFVSHTEDCMYLKDNDLKIQSMSTGMLKLIGESSLDNVLNQTISEIIAKKNVLYSKLMGKLQKQDLQVIKNRKRGIYLEIIPNAGSLKIVVINKTPIINPDTDNVLGIHGQIGTLIWPSLIKTLFRMNGTKGLLLNQKCKTDPLIDYPLTNIQHIVLFLCINNYSYSEIALLMSEFGNPITSIRVNDYLEQLKLIFHVRTKAQLIEKAIGLNFHTLLPYNLFNNFSTIEISDDLATIICCNCRIGTCTEHVNNKVIYSDEDIDE